MSGRLLLTAARLLALWSTSVFLLANTAVHADPSPHDIVAPSLVYLKVSFTPTRGQFLGVPQTDQSTGFFVSNDGFILTSYHLLEKLTKSAGENVTVSASIGDPEAQPVTAAIVNGAQTLDLLLLKIRPTPLNPRFPGLKLGHAGALNSGDHIYTSGFSDKELVTDGNTVSNRTWSPWYRISLDSEYIGRARTKWFSRLSIGRHSYRSNQGREQIDRQGVYGPD